MKMHLVCPCVCPVPSERCTSSRFEVSENHSNHNASRRNPGIIPRRQIPFRLETTTVTHGQCVDNGNLAASNVSKVNVHTLLGPSQQNAKVYTTYIPYWGNTSHPNIGYSSVDPVQVAREISEYHQPGF